MPMRTKFQGWENSQDFREWEADLEERDKLAVRQAVEALSRRERTFKIRWSAVALWASILAFTGLVYGFAWAWLGPVIHRLLARLGWWQP